MSCSFEPKDNSRKYYDPYECQACGTSIDYEENLCNDCKDDHECPECGNYKEWDEEYCEECVEKLEDEFLSESYYRL